MPLLDSVLAQSTDGNTVTSAAMSTTGAKLMVVAVDAYGTGGGISISDSLSNTWVAMPYYQATSSSALSKLFYCIDPIVGGSHTVTVYQSPGVLFYPTITVMAFDDTVTFDTVREAGFGDQENGNYALGVTSLGSGSVLPQADGALIISTVAYNTSGPSVSGGGLAIIESASVVSGQAMAGATAIDYQVTAASIAAAWSWSGGSSTAAASIIVFGVIVVPEQKVGAFVAGAYGTVTSTLTALFNMDGSTRTVHLSDGGSAFSGGLSLIEQAAPSTPVSNMGRIYVEDNGSGKTRLMVQFGSGSPVQLAIEP